MINTLLDSNSILRSCDIEYLVEYDYGGVMTN